jgi:hypothetical protein
MKWISLISVDVSALGVMAAERVVGGFQTALTWVAHV